MGKVKAMYMEQEEQIMEWYYDGITLEKAKHLAELSFGSSVIELVDKYGESYYLEKEHYGVGEPL
jgi:hypothetical protein